MSNGDSTIHSPAPLPEWAVGYVYLFETDASWQKIGFSTDPASRINAFQTLPFRVWLAHSFPVGRKNIEWQIQAAAKPYHVRGEWYTLPDSFVAVFKEQSGILTAESLPEPLVSASHLAALRASWEKQKEVAEDQERGRLAREDRRYLRKLRDWKGGIVWKQHSGWHGCYRGSMSQLWGVAEDASQEEALAAFAKSLFGDDPPPTDDDLAAMLAEADAIMARQRQS